MKIFHWTCFVFSFPRSFFPFVIPSEQLVSRNVGCFLSSSLPVCAAALLALCLSWHQGAGGSSPAAVLVTISSVFFFESHISHVYFMLFVYRARGNVWHFIYLSWSLLVFCGSQQSHWEYGKRKVNLTGVYRFKLHVAHGLKSTLFSVCTGLMNSKTLPICIRWI